MKKNKQIIRLDSTHLIFVQKLYYCTNEDILIWEAISDETDCEYIAEIEGIKFRLGCNPLKSYFFIDGKSFLLHWKEIETLCRLISQQRTRLKNKNEKLETIICILNNAIDNGAQN